MRCLFRHTDLLCCLQGSHSALTAQHISLVAENRETSQQHDALKLTTAQQAAQHTHLLAAHQQLAQEHSVSQAELATAAQLNAQLRSEKSALESASESHLKRYDSLHTDHAALCHEKESISCQHAELQAAHCQLQEEYTGLQSGKVVLTQQLRDQLAEVESRHETLSAEHDHLAFCHQQLANAKQCSDFELTALKMEHVELTQSRSDLVTTHQVLQGQLAQMTDQCSDSEAQLAELQARHLGLQAQHSELIADKESIIRTHSELQGLNSRLTESYTQLQQQHQELSTASQQVQSELEVSTGREAAMAAAQLTFQQQHERLLENKATVDSSLASAHTELATVTGAKVVAVSGRSGMLCQPSA